MCFLGCGEASEGQDEGRPVWENSAGLTVLEQQAAALAAPAIAAVAAAADDDDSLLMWLLYSLSAAGRVLQAWRNVQTPSFNCWKVTALYGCKTMLEFFYISNLTWLDRKCSNSGRGINERHSLVWSGNERQFICQVFSTADLVTMWRLFTWQLLCSLL